MDGISGCRKNVRITERFLTTSIRHPSRDYVFPAPAAVPLILGIITGHFNARQVIPCSAHLSPCMGGAVLELGKHSLPHLSPAVCNA